MVSGSRQGQPSPVFVVAPRGDAQGDFVPLVFDFTHILLISVETRRGGQRDVRQHVVCVLDVVFRTCADNVVPGDVDSEVVVVDFLPFQLGVRDT